MELVFDHPHFPDTKSLLFHSRGWWLAGVGQIGTLHRDRRQGRQTVSD